MGVPGLWDLLRPAGKQRSLTQLAVVDGFERNKDQVRGYRIGIDASIWFYHATYGREGENPELRTLFFRCARLMSLPFLPLFVFDGPDRPKEKRGKRITGNHHWMVQGMQGIINAFGFQYRTAPGEAEAELAYLNRIGIIDAVLSDDVDTFLFGATMVVRNPSATLSGNQAHPMKNAAGKVDDNHVVTYSLHDINKKTGLTQGGFILIGILRGGDYHQAGLPGCGVATAHGLAKCGFGDSLLASARNLEGDELDLFLDDWRTQVRNELRTNTRGLLPRKSPALAKALTDDFPNTDVLELYVRPITSESKGKSTDDIRLKWDRDPNLDKIAGVCELYFEWGVKEIIIKRFRSVIWTPSVIRILRRSTIRFDRASSDDSASSTSIASESRAITQRVAVGTPYSMVAKHLSSLPASEDLVYEDEELIVKIHSSRTHPSTDGLLEYRLEVAPAQLVHLSEAGIKGIRTAVDNGSSASDGECNDDGSNDESDKRGRGTKKTPTSPESHLRMWVPASMVKIALPSLVDKYEATQKEKLEKRAKKPTKKSKARDRPKDQEIEVVEASPRTTTPTSDFTTSPSPDIVEIFQLQEREERISDKRTTAEKVDLQGYFKAAKYPSSSKLSKQQIKSLPGSSKAVQISGASSGNMGADYSKRDPPRQSRWPKSTVAGAQSNLKGKELMNAIDFFEEEESSDNISLDLESLPLKITKPKPSSQLPLVDEPTSAPSFSHHSKTRYKDSQKSSKDVISPAPSTSSQGASYSTTSHLRNRKRTAPANQPVIEILSDSDSSVHISYPQDARDPSGEPQLLAGRRTENPKKYEPEVIDLT